MFMVLKRCLLSVPLYLDIVKIEGDVPVPSKEEQERKNKASKQNCQFKYYLRYYSWKEPG